MQGWEVTSLREGAQATTGCRSSSSPEENREQLGNRPKNPQGFPSSWEKGEGFQSRFSLTFPPRHGPKLSLWGHPEPTPPQKQPPWGGAEARMGLFQQGRVN